MHRFDQYIYDVQAGNILTGRFIKLAIARHIKDLENPEFYFDAEEAQRAINFCEVCRHWKGAKAKNKERIVLEAWQCFYIGSIFGWRRIDGTKRYRRTYMQVARKNAKTTMLALITLYHLVMEGEDGSQVYCGATKEAQAQILVNDTGQIVNKTPELRKRFKIFKIKSTINQVYYPKTESFVTALGRDSKTQDGTDPSMGNIDELHEHKTFELLDVIVSGMGSRVEPLLNLITTSGFNKENPCYTVTRKTGIEILEGVKKDDTFLILIYEMDEKDKWDDEQMWIKSNPNLGASVQRTFLKEEFQTAKNEGGRTEVNFKTKLLNMWVDAPEVWIQDYRWMKNSESEPDLKGAICYGGIDLGKTLDLNAFVLLFPGFDKMVLKAWFWIPEETLKNANNDSYNQWVKAGYLRVIPGSIARGSVIAKDILEIVQPYKLESTAYDPFIATHECIPILDDAGLILSPLGQRIVDLSPHTKKLESLVYDKKLNHLKNPIMRWMMGNVVIQVDQNGNIKIDKKKSGNKIDGIASTVNAIAQWTDFEDDSSIYKTRGIRVIGG